MTQILNKWKVDAIFQKDEQGNYYTNDALLFQDILLYCLEINKTVLENNQFKLRELQRWVVQNNKEIKEYYQDSKAHTSISNKIHAKEVRINNKFEGLLELRLIRRSIVARNVQLTIPLYIDTKVSFEYTKGGVLLALIIKGMNLKKVITSTKREDKIIEYRKELEKTYQHVYDILDLIFKVKEDSSASDIYYSTLLKKCKDKGLFDKLVERIHYIINTGNNIINMVDLFERVVYFALFDKQQSQTDFLDVFHETVEELDQEVKKLILYRMKISAEKGYEIKQEDLTRQYEEFRFKLRSDYERIAVQGYCENCKSKQNLALHYSDLISRADSDDDIKVNCPSCNCSLIYHKD